VILFDPNANATASSPVLPPSRLTERDTNSSNMASVPSGMISAAELIPTHSVNTRFFTTQGLVSVSYLHQPPRTALTSIIANGAGDLDISLHPNYVGPFILKDLWGDIRLPQLQAITKSDPQGWGRTRTMVFGDVETPEGSMFSGAGLNESVIANSGSLITGAAYWAGPGPGVRNGTVLSAKDVQNADEGKGSEVAIMGSWGDIRVCFDGT